MTDKPLISFDYAIKYLLKDKGDYEIVWKCQNHWFAGYGKQ
ncbi:MAG: hypothetical protein K0R52_929 [Alphaproteobacteria bacterium]|nr:hypothetical protein [Alphaproteobacteria bacterium]